MPASLYEENLRTRICRFTNENYLKKCCGIMDLFGLFEREIASCFTRMIEAGPSTSTRLDWHDFPMRLIVCDSPERGRHGGRVINDGRKQRGWPEATHGDVTRGYTSIVHRRATVNNRTYRALFYYFLVRSIDGLVSHRHKDRAVIGFCIDAFYRVWRGIYI